MLPFRLFIYNIVRRALPETRCFGFKVAMLRWCGARVGNDVRVNSSAMISGNGELEIGNDVWIGAKDLLMSTAPALIKIGSQCDLGPQVSIITGTHEINTGEGHIAGKGKSVSVEINDGCWIGARSIILPGVVLPNRTLVAAGSVVVKSITESNALLAGCPAIVKKIYE